MPRPPFAVRPSLIGAPSLTLLAPGSLAAPVSANAAKRLPALQIRVPASASMALKDDGFYKPGGARAV